MTKTTKIEPEFKKKWLEALRSGKYEQGRLFLKNLSGKYCCLGVACDISNNGKWLPGSNCYNFEESENGNIAENHLPSTTKLEYFSDEKSPYIVVDDLTLDDRNEIRKKFGNVDVITLADLNDSWSFLFTFEEIANFIEKYM